MIPLRGFDLLNDQVCVTNYLGMLCENLIGGLEGSEQIDRRVMEEVGTKSLE